MDVWSRTQLVLCLLAASVATGCETPHGFRNESALPPDPGDSTTVTNAPPNGGGYARPGASDWKVAPAGGTGAAPAVPGSPAAPTTSAVQQAQADGPGPTLPTPRPQPAPPGWPAGVPLPPPGQSPQMPPPAPLPGSTLQLPPGGVDPHQRAFPTVTGGRLNLAPNEVPTDRVVDLAKQLDLVLGQNRDLIARLKELEAIGIGREQALAEAMREIDAITAEGLRTRAALQGQVLALQGKVRQLEDEDIFFLRAVIDALSKLLPPERKP